MTVKEVYLDGAMRAADLIPEHAGSLPVFLEVMTLCNDSKISAGEDGKPVLLGDPTETALISFASEKGVHKPDLENTLPRKSEIPFDSDRKLMTTINDLTGEFRVLTKGAPDVLVSRCDRILTNGEIKPLDEKHLEELRAANTKMGGKALRVLAMAYKNIDTIPETLDSLAIEANLIFVGLVGMIDPPREEVKEAVRICREAGIRPIMITGDHRDTASAIAKELAIIKDESEVISGSDLDKISEADFEKLVVKYSVYARVSPEHKVRIVKAWKNLGKVVAMTGDGVNDAPALKTSDIGVGMGITGTDVAKGVSDMVLADDNFATIVYAVEEGRKIYSNIRKAIQFLLSANMSEVVTLFVGTLLNWTILFPIHILWINLVTDAFPALALGVERAEKDIMKQKPRKSKSSFFAEGMGISILYQGLLLGLITLSVYYYGLSNYSEGVAVTMAFATLGLVQLAHSLNVRSNRKSLFSLGLFTNLYLIGAIAFSALLQVIVILVPFLNRIFRVSALNSEQWLIVIIASLSIIPMVEIVKVLQRSVRK
jgi:P-type Ca2+ transporter type 2C